MSRARRVERRGAGPYTRGMTRPADAAPTHRAPARTPIHVHDPANAPARPRSREADRVAAYQRLMTLAPTLTGPRPERLGRAADLLWEALSPTGVSWIGFYEIARPGNTHGAVPGEQMILGPCRNKPACSPIGLQGVCGRGFLERRSIVVHDVRSLGANYIACDPRDLSEVVVPLFDEAGDCWGVLDADSFEVGAFDAGDAEGLEGFLSVGVEK